jgi:hypothetical protein
MIAPPFGENAGQTGKPLTSCLSDMLFPGAVRIASRLGCLFYPCLMAVARRSMHGQSKKLFGSKEISILISGI